MIPYLQQLVSSVDDPTNSLPIVREYLQARILEELQHAGAYRCLAFHGGTALRFLYDIPRFSEDLDFAVESRSEQYDFIAYLRAIEKRFTAENYTLDIRTKKEQTTVNNAFIRFRGLLFELGLTPHENQVLAIKLEIDTNPPAEAVTTTTLLQRHVGLHVRHHDRATLLAGKLHAVFERAYIKGRDWYDLWWYLSQPNWPLPNFAHLNNSLHQSNSSLPKITVANWKPILNERIRLLDWAGVLNDVEPFIIKPNERIAFNKETLLAFVESSDM